jgi:hypothetical protein
LAVGDLLERLGSARLCEQFPGCLEGLWGHGVFRHGHQCVGVCREGLEVEVEDGREELREAGNDGWEPEVQTGTVPDEVEQANGRKVEHGEHVRE